MKDIDFCYWIYVISACTLVALGAYFFTALVAVALIVASVCPFVAWLLIEKRVDFKRLTVRRGESVSRLTRLQTVFLALSALGVLYVFIISIVRWVFVGGLGTKMADDTFEYIGLAGIVFAIPLIADFFIIKETDGQTVDQSVQSVNDQKSDDTIV